MTKLNNKLLFCYYIILFYIKTQIFTIDFMNLAKKFYINNFYFKKFSFLIIKLKFELKIIKYLTIKNS